MIVLGLDTSTNMTAVALYDDTTGVVGETRAVRPGSHAESALPHLEHLFDMTGLSIDDVDLIAVGIGPGSFTGLRIAVTMAKTLSQAKNIPLVGVSTLEAMANGVNVMDGIVVPAIDARRERVFMGVYKKINGEIEVVESDRVIPISEIPSILPNEKINLCGTHGYLLKDVITDSIIQGNEGYAMSAVNIAVVGKNYYLKGKIDDYRTLAPIYIAPTRADKLSER
ncbi:MAG: tRNA (adenosine(37)-N6)-threonylcarbamoyltransferase complex dimerization subunit type 1 TsaB [Tissierellia bacterium]|nr:tRNA (adenosine(37)-N6)-threonylcarbamoyltransferase complex dimerization subunit type 1 TsaB [Tissierellia bacterium]